MAKRDELLARIDADIARLKDIEVYAQTHGDNQKLLEIINDEITEFLKIRKYVTQEGEATSEPKKRGRKKKAPGLPADTATD